MNALSPLASTRRRRGLAGSALLGAPLLGALGIAVVAVGVAIAIAARTPDPVAPAPVELGAAESDPQTEPDFGARIPPWNEDEYIGVVVSLMATSTDGSSIGGQNLIVAWGTYLRLLNELELAREDDRFGLRIVVAAGPGAAEWGIVPGSEVSIGRWSDCEVALQKSLMVGDSWFGEAIRVQQWPRE